MPKLMEISINELPKTKADALSLGVKYFFAGTTCKNGHISPRKAFLNKSKCLECMRIGARKATAKMRARNPEKYRESANQAQRKLRAEGRDWASRNRIEQRAKIAKWKSENLDKGRYYAMKRKAASLLATPQWLTESDWAQIGKLYTQAVEVSAMTGTKHEVDHIVPLQGKTVCGLHVPWNLRVITATENNRRPRIWREQEN